MITQCANFIGQEFIEEIVFVVIKIIWDLKYFDRIRVKISRINAHKSLGIIMLKLVQKPWIKKTLDVLSLKVPDMALNRKNVNNLEEKPKMFVRPENNEKILAFNSVYTKKESFRIFYDADANLVTCEQFISPGELAMLQEKGEIDVGVTLDQIQLNFTIEQTAYIAEALNRFLKSHAQ